MIVRENVIDVKNLIATENPEIEGYNEIIDRAIFLTWSIMFIEGPYVLVFLDPVIMILK